MPLSSDSASSSQPQRRPEIIYLSPSPEPEEELTQSNQVGQQQESTSASSIPSSAAVISPGRPLSRSPLSIGDDLFFFDEPSSATLPLPMASSSSSGDDGNGGASRRTASEPERPYLSPSALSEEEDAGPLFLASVARAESSRARRRRTNHPIGLPPFSQGSADGQSSITRASPFSRILEALSHAAPDTYGHRHSSRRPPRQPRRRPTQAESTRGGRPDADNATELLPLDDSDDDDDDDAASVALIEGARQQQDALSWIWDEDGSDTPFSQQIPQEIRMTDAHRQRINATRRTETTRPDSRAAWADFLERNGAELGSDRSHTSHRTNTIVDREAEVRQLRCSAPSCGALLCSRAFQPKPRLRRELHTASSSQMKFQRRVFSTEAPPPSNVAVLPQSHSVSSCGCARVSLGCTTCGTVVGYHLLSICEACDRTFGSTPTPGQPHAFFFHHSAVLASNRLGKDSARQSPTAVCLQWKDLPSLESELADGLVGDPIDWLYPAGRSKSSATPFWWPSRRPPTGTASTKPCSEDLLDAQNHAWTRWCARRQLSRDQDKQEDSEHGGATEDRHLVDDHFEFSLIDQPRSSLDRSEAEKEAQARTTVPPTCYGMLAGKPQFSSQSSPHSGERLPKRRRLPIAGR